MQMRIELSLHMDTKDRYLPFKPSYDVNQKADRESSRSYQLFCEAISYKKNNAWVEIQTKYHFMIRHWISQSVSGLCEHDMDDLIQSTYTRFWYSLTKNQISLEEKFLNLGCILQYLKKCAVSTSIDFLRKKQKLEALEENLTAEFLLNGCGHYKEQEPSELVYRIQEWVKNDVQDPQERLLIKLIFEYNLKPKQVVAEYPDHFSTTKDVNRIRERLLKRARRQFC